MKMTDIAVRPEKEEDRTQIATLIARTYLTEGAQTIEMASKLRSLKNHNTDLSFLGEMDGKPVAFTMFTPVKVGDTEDAALLAAPMARDVTRDDVDFPLFLSKAMDQAKEQGHRYVMLFGEEGTFSSLGFETAESKGIKDTIKPVGADLLVKDLNPDAGDGAKGNVEYPDVLK